MSEGTHGNASRSRATKASTSATAAAASGAEEKQTPAHVCTVGFCPLCMAVSTLQPIKPDAVEHLLKAGREFLLAVKSVIDARVEDVPEEDGPRLERIDIA
jgi:hypothetical protein